jgi:hypothetical protein
LHVRKNKKCKKGKELVNERKRGRKCKPAQMFSD